MLFDFASAKYIGIVCAGEDETGTAHLKDFLHFLSQKGIKYLVLGYFPAKKIPDNFLYWKGIEFITQSDLNLFLIPQSPIAEKFIDEQFDMLINCSVADHFPVEYIAQLSRAKCKVGIMRGEDSCYDLTIDIKKQKNVEYFMENLKIYLSNIRNSI